MPLVCQKNVDAFSLLQGNGKKKRGNGDKQKNVYIIAT